MAAWKWAAARFLVEQSFAHLGLLLYAVLAVVGMVYVWAFYKRFDIAILDFYETPDFLLSVASDPRALVAGVFGVGLALVLLLFAYSFSATRSVYRDSYSLYREAKDVQRARRFLAGTVVVGVVTLPTPVLVAWTFGTISAKSKADNPQPVQVTLRSSSAADAAALPAAGATTLPDAGQTILVGTTNRYHFFYECKPKQGDPPLNCAEGEPFIVGTDNVAAIAYEQNTAKIQPPTDVASAIGRLADAVSGLGSDGTITIGKVDATLDMKDLAEAVARLAKAAAPLTVEARLDPSDVTLRAVVDPPELTVKAELPDGTIPDHSHGQSRPLIVVPNGDMVTPVYVVPFRPLSPLTTRSQGISIPPRTREWLGEFYKSLQECGDVRVTVTGYASRRGFGDPRHQSIWGQVANDQIQQTMNCGLANLRAITVVSALLGSTGSEHARLAAARHALEECHSHRQCLSAGDCDPERECCCLHQKAETVRDRLLDLCTTPLEEWNVGGDDGPPVRVHAWGEDGNWSWVDDDDSRLLSRSVHITLDATSGQLTCPQVSGVGEWSQAVNGT